MKFKWVALLKKAKAMSPEEYNKEYDNLYDKLALNNDYEGFWDLVINYIDNNLK